MDKVSTAVDEKELGIGLQVSIQVGNGRSLGFTAGFPLDWDVSKINGVVDKLIAVSDRQAMRYELHDRKAAINSMYHQIDVQLKHRADAERKLREGFVSRGKHGDFRPSQAQQAQLDNYDVSVQGLRDAVFKAEKEYEELEQKCR